MIGVIDFIKRHPLLTGMNVALLLRLCDVGCAPLYTLFNHSIVKILELPGVISLDPMMHVVRLLYVFLWLLIVWYGFKYVLPATGCKNDAMVAAAII